ncbi:hypothetical protein CMQ_2385 [Grosmannia clavigera kw1407]|uniref:Uncharacterized protein n=1 Tax=Grosmannia clavigera (strain kw1407 / UAMH 11150) TaxID=655863 RepID=F0XJ92_GROCL|nr:uncharacterized protein CMQ_2385 [Grosmannia clavigera kw1407]EFX02336.1 hypothetical protein CMQ_2385 [Grosmannia clavigera kw1407]
MEKGNGPSRERAVYFLRKEQPSVNLALPPVGWHSTVVQPWQMTTVCACEKTVVMVKQPGHLTSMKKERGVGTRVCRRESVSRRIARQPGSLVGAYLELVLLGLSSSAGVEQIDGQSLKSKKSQHVIPVAGRDNDIEIRQLVIPPAAPSPSMRSLAFCSSGERANRLLSPPPL